MTSDDRNRRMKYGHDVPRWWIPEFNNTHKKEGEKEKSPTSKPPAGPSGDELLSTAKLQRTRQQLFEQQRRWAEHRISNATAASRECEKRSTNDRYAVKRRARQIKQEDQKRLLNRDIRIVQWILAVFFTLIGILGGGIVGLVFGVAIGVVLVSFRLEI